MLSPIRKISIHPSIFYTRFFCTGLRESWCRSPAVYGRELRGGGTSWTGRQSIVEQHRDTQDKQPFIPKGNLERPLNLTVMFLDYGRKPEYPERTHKCMHRENMQTSERPPAGSRTQDLLAARQQCFPIEKYIPSKNY
ncbi:hypothetical protein ATANTOWER_012399 [Ataeniobius toweri]|uniref:Uncharacterized protein n=1 Tax=Ataeniobius toweri TaxID=208326 RepID=A0ABU7B8U3_9TELE|nr:hypothetical protein [Ataeniobius toweri]